MVLYPRSGYWEQRIARKYRVMQGGVLDRLSERMSVVVIVKEQTVREKGNVCSMKYLRKEKENDFMLKARVGRTIG